MRAGGGRAGGRGVALLPLLLLLCIQAVYTGGLTSDEGSTTLSPTRKQHTSKEDAAKQEQVSAIPTQTVTPEHSDRKKNDEEDDRLHGGKNVEGYESTEDVQVQDLMSHEDGKDVKRDVREEDEKMWGMDEEMIGPPRRRLSLAAQLIARLVTLTTGRHPSTHRSQPASSLHARAGARAGNTDRNPSSNYGRLRRFGHGRRGWGVGRWQGRAPRPRNYPHPNHGSTHGERRFNPHGHGVPQPRKMPQPKMPQPKMPSLHGLHVPHVRGVQAPNLHGMSLPGSPHLRSHHQPNLRPPQPPRFNNMNVPRPPRMPNLSPRSLPRMYSPGAPNTQVTLNMITRMIKEGKIPPINFNCNSNNHILHLVQQHTEEDKKKRRKKRSLSSRYYSSEEESDEEAEYSDEDYRSNEEVEAKKILPLLKKVEAKDIHALNHQMRHPRPYGRPIIHHHGPRILLVCISNTYLSTIIKKYRGSGSDESD